MPLNSIHSKLMLNNIKNISMLPEYASLCGITEEEMREQMARISVVWLTTSALLRRFSGALKSNYDGYHFTWPSPDIYNPFSLLNALTDSNQNSYWFGMGTSTLFDRDAEQVSRKTPANRRTQGFGRVV